MNAIKSIVLKSLPVIFILTGSLVVLIAVMFLVSRSGTQETKTFTGSYDIRLQPSQANAEKTDIIVRDAQGAETKLLTLSDVYRDHYHAAEFQDGYLYIIKRPGGSEAYETNPNWTDELWRYNANGDSKKLYAAQGLDFRVSADVDRIAIFLPDRNKSLIITDLQGNTQRVVAWSDVKEMSVDDAVRPLLWSTQNLWFMAVQGLQVKSVFSLDEETGSITGYEIANLGAVQKDFSLEPTSKAIVFSNYRTPIDENGKTRQSVTLSVYRLATNERNIIVVADMDKPFDPRWINPSTIEYNNPSAPGRTTTRIEE